MANKSQSRAERLVEAKRLYYTHPSGLLDSELAALMGIDLKGAYLVRKQLGATATGQGRGRYQLIPTQADIELAHAILSASK